MIKIYCLASSSDGNAYVIEKGFDNGTTVRVLIECGLPYRELNRKLIQQCRFDLTSIDAIIVTHGHGDHAKAIPNLAILGKPIYATATTFKMSMSPIAGVAEIVTETLPKHLHILKWPHDQKAIAYQTTIRSFSVLHDIDEPVGFSITMGDDNLLFINDSKYVEWDLSGTAYDYVMIECNYMKYQVDHIYRMAKASGDKGTAAHYARLIKSHMSNETTLETLKSLNLKKCKGIFLMHLSDRNSDPREMMSSISKATNVKTYVCEKHGGISQ